MVAASDYLTLSEVSALTKLSKSTIYRLAGNGTFPKPFKWGGRGVRWDAGEVETWMRNRPRAEIGRA